MQRTATGHVVGATYHSKYWGQWYQVFDLASVLGGDNNGVKVRWEDGRETTHCTPREGDKLVREPQPLEF